MQDLLVATTNNGKFGEIAAFFTALPFRLLSLRDLPGVPSVIEDGSTFLDNARKKAHQIAAWSGQLTLADDSGIVVDALEGRPGVHSARYAGENATDEDNRRKLLRELREFPEEKRGAAFVCVLVLARPDGRELVAEGKIEGVITEAPRGDGGFGYDPLFLVPELQKTTAELEIAQKNQLSHRGRALRALVEALRSVPIFY